MPLPAIPIIGALLAKKAVGYAIYRAGNEYGWARIYRTALRVTHRITPPAHRPMVQQTLRAAIEVPGRAMQALQNNETYAVLEETVLVWGSEVATATSKMGRRVAEHVVHKTLGRAVPSAKATAPGPWSSHEQQRLHALRGVDVARAHPASSSHGPDAGGQQLK
ncbi:hypothetical protein EON67_07290 [archaeon]|nr:MAG: hypothetical protein EON67_07290 [archaeon]